MTDSRSYPLPDLKALKEAVQSREPLARNLLGDDFVMKRDDALALVERIGELETALGEIAQKGGVGPYEPPRQGHRPDPWYNSLVRCGEIARTALRGNQA